MNLMNLLIRLDSDTEIELIRGSQTLYSGKVKNLMCDERTLQLQVNVMHPQHTSNKNYLEIYVF